MISSKEFNYVANGCPRNYPGSYHVKVAGDSKHNVRCCSRRGETCTSEQCSNTMTYLQASDICLNKGARLCYKRELNGCCNTGCTSDKTTYWVTPGIYKYTEVINLVDYNMKIKTDLAKITFLKINNCF